VAYLSIVAADLENGLRLGLVSSDVGDKETTMSSPRAGSTILPLPMAGPTVNMGPEDMAFVGDRDIDVDAGGFNAMLLDLDDDFFNFDLLNDSLEQRLKLLADLPWFQLQTVLHKSRKSRQSSWSSPCLYPFQMPAKIGCP
jgi:hypothetical protein